MAKPLDLTRARKKSDKLIKQNEKKIETIYKNAGKEISEKLINSDNSLETWQLQSTYNQINNKISEINSNVEYMVRGSIEQTAEFVIDDVNMWTRTFGVSFKNAFVGVPTNIVDAIASGAVYDGNWNLSSAIWGHGQKIKDDLMSVISQGFAQNKSVFDIAKDIEKYMDPTKIKTWDWSKVYPGTNKVVDYNAQRLVRTVMQHAYQQSFIHTTYHNPFVTQYRWLASGSHRMCSVCEERDGQIFDKDDLPMDHPNGMCTYEGIIPYDNEQITDRLADWVKGGSDSELDEWLENM